MEMADGRGLFWGGGRAVLSRPKVDLQIFMMSTLPCVLLGPKMCGTYFYPRQRILVLLALGREFKYCLLFGLCLKLG